MQNTTNAFLDGLMMDFHPLTMPETAMTSALNATIITFNGNELILLNDMGNTLIKDKITGKIMSLNDGFVPLGMKEHGGVLYIASYNPSTKEGELGTIPSPVIHYSDTKTDSKTQDIKISDIKEDAESDKIEERLNSGLIYISDKLFHAGDKFIVLLDFNDYSKISKIKINERSWFKLNLYAVTDLNKEVLLSNVISSPQQYYNSKGTLETSEYWFIKSGETIDYEKTKFFNGGAGYFRSYPNIPAGKLAIRFEFEQHSKLNYSKNASCDSNCPMLYVHEGKKAYVIVNGFIYSGNCGLRPDKIKINIKNDYDLYDPKSITTDSPKKLSSTYFNLNLHPNYPSEYPGESSYVLLKTGLPNTLQKKIISGVENYNQTDTESGLFAIELDNINTDIVISLDLYVKDSEGNYYYYRTDVLPPFNPAYMYLNGEKPNKNNHYVNLYYEFDKTDSDYFELELFDTSDSKYQRCLVSNSQNEALKYNKDTRRYEPENDVRRSYTNWINQITWIYPQTTSREEQNHSAAPAYKKGQLLSCYSYDNPDLSNLTFVLSSVLPTVTGTIEDENGNIIDSNTTTLNLLVPANRNNGDWKDQLEKQVNYFNTIKNDYFELTHSELKANSIYSVNSRTISEDININIFSSLNNCFKDGNWDITANDFLYGIERFWNTRDQQNKYIRDPAICMLQDFSQTKTDVLKIDNSKENKQGMNDVSFPCYLSGGNNEKINYLSIALPDNEIRTFSNYCKGDELKKGFLYYYLINCPGSFLAKNTTEKNSYSSLQFGKAGIIGFGSESENKHLMNDLWKLNQKDISTEFKLNYLFINNKYPSNYLYKKELSFNLVNVGHTNIRYINPCFYKKGKTYKMYEDYDEFTLKLQHKLGTTITTMTSTCTSPFKISDLDPKWQIKKNLANTNQNLIFNTNQNLIVNTKVINTVLTNAESISIPTSVKTYDYKLTLSVDDCDSKDYRKESRIINLSPVIVTKISSGSQEGSLARSYKSDYKLIKQISLGEVGYSDNGTLMSASVKEQNLLLTSEQHTGEEYMTDILDPNSLDILKTPADMGFVNSFDNIKGYRELIITGKYTSIFDQPKTINLKGSDDKAQGWYVLTINHNQTTSKDVEDLRFKLRIKRNNESFVENSVYSSRLTGPQLTLAKEKLKATKFCMVFKVPKNDKYTLDLLFFIKKEASLDDGKVYIKNIGLYELDTTYMSQNGEYDITNLITEQNKDKILYLLDLTGDVHSGPEYYRSIIFPAVYCYKEITEDNQKIGCIDKEFTGFSALPINSRQRLAGFYGIKNDLKTAYFIKDSADYRLGSSTEINNNIIREANDT